MAAGNRLGGDGVLLMVSHFFASVRSPFFFSLNFSPFVHLFFFPAAKDSSNKNQKFFATRVVKSGATGMKNDAFPFFFCERMDLKTPLGNDPA